MKIWYQSAAAIEKNRKYDEYLAILRSYLSKVARPGTEVTVHGVEISSPKVQTLRYEELLHDKQIIDNLLLAQKRGYDGFCVGCILDPAFYQMREVADIPVLSLAEASMLLACLLSPNFALLCHHKPTLLRVIELVKRYGLRERYFELDSLKVTPEDLLRAFQEPEILMAPARQLAKEAASKGVCMFVCAEGIINMIMAKHNIHFIEGIPVLEGGGALLKMTETLVDLKAMGMDRSKLGLFTPISKEDLANLHQLYGVKGI